MKSTVPLVFSKVPNATPTESPAIDEVEINSFLARSCHTPCPPYLCGAGRQNHKSKDRLRLTGRRVAPNALRQRDCSAHRDQCRVHSLWTKHPSFCSFQRACFVTIFQLRRVDKFSLAAAGRPQAASTQPIERYGFAGFRVLVRSFHASTLSLVLIHAAGITKQHMFALLQQAFEQLVREEYELDTRYAVCANVLSNYVFSDTATRRPGTKH